MTHTPPQIGFIGAGNMASAIIGGLVSKGYDPQAITAAEPSTEKLQRFSESLGVKTTTDNTDVAAEVDILVLSVKPQVLEHVCQDISSHLKAGALVISIAAGIELSTLESWLGQEQAIVRCMPNTPAKVQLGASGLIANTQVSDQQKTHAEQLFEAIGLCEWVDDEKLMHSVTALSGSGPAYIFMVIEAMEKAAIKQGIEASTARMLAAQTVKGAAEMVLTEGIEPEQLKRNVMSPGGTTERAIESFEKAGLIADFDNAMQAAADRSIELAELLKG